MARVEVIEYCGINFRRYPDSERWADRVYFTPGIGDRQRGVKRLHEEVWIGHHGPILAGHHVHHLDHDPLNNDPGNLACISDSDHREHHATDPRSVALKQQADWLAHLATIRPKAAAWHSSAAGVAWHREHGRRSWEHRELRAAACEQCGSAFESALPKRFCSNACKSAARRASGRDNETRTCPYCTEPFMVNRYSKARFCSRSCANRARRAMT